MRETIEILGLALAILVSCGIAAHLWDRAVKREARRHRTPTPTVKTAVELPFRAPDILHLCTEPEMRPLCGASIREPWTIDPEAATCPACRENGDSMMLQWWATNR